tara:strand:+ start:1420 stop:2262 length:843 start_codon:yes stop_codon:yes gene_type:complete
MNKTMIIGGGMLGNQLSEYLKEKKFDVSIKKNIKYESRNIIPNKTKNVIITAQSPDYRSKQFTTDLLYVNTILPLQIIKESYEKNVENIIYCSTGSVYQNKTTGHKESERIDIEKLTPYSASKFSAEMLIQQWEQYFKSITVLRPFFMYGSTQSKEMLFSKMVDSIKNNKEITLSNNLGLVFNPIHVNDAARFIFSLLNKTKKFHTFNVAGSEEVSLFTIVEKLGKILNKKPNIKTVKKRHDVVLGSIKKMNDVNFKHKILIKDGLKEMVTGKISNKKLF